MNLSSGLLKSNLQPKPSKWHWTFVLRHLAFKSHSRMNYVKWVFWRFCTRISVSLLNCNVMLDGLETKHDLIRHLHLKWIQFFPDYLLDFLFPSLTHTHTFSLSVCVFLSHYFPISLFICGYLFFVAIIFFDVRCSLLATVSIQRNHCILQRFNRLLTKIWTNLCNAKSF